MPVVIVAGFSRRRVVRLRSMNYKYLRYIIYIWQLKKNNLKMPDGFSVISNPSRLGQQTRLFYNLNLPDMRLL